MRDAALAIIREIGVETGGSNIQFAVNPGDGRMVVIEMNPRVSRSSALASKATGFPIAKIAAKLAVGYTLDELRNDITRETPACFEPTIDYCVVKIPRWAFEKFPEADQTLTTQMKSVGEVMAIGRTFKEALQKAIRSLEQDRHGLGLDRPAAGPRGPPGPPAGSQPRPAPPRRRGVPARPRRDEIAGLTRIDPWFLAQMRGAGRLRGGCPAAARPARASALRQAKRLGFSDRRLGRARGRAGGRGPRRRGWRTASAPPSRWSTPARRSSSPTRPTSTRPTRRRTRRRRPPGRKVVILGSGPNRIGQGIEFDYAACTPPSPSARRASRPSWSTATPRRCPPTTTPPTASTSSR